MSFDCSVTKRKGCNYCLRAKNVYDENKENVIFVIEEKNRLGYINNYGEVQAFEINYCPVCGKELKEK